MTIFYISQQFVHTNLNFVHLYPLWQHVCRFCHTYFFRTLSHYPLHRGVVKRATKCIIDPEWLRKWCNILFTTHEQFSRFPMAVYWVKRDFSSAGVFFLRFWNIVKFLKISLIVERFKKIFILRTITNFENEKKLKPFKNWNFLKIWKDREILSMAMLTTNRKNCIQMYFRSQPG